MQVIELSFRFTRLMSAMLIAICAVGCGLGQAPTGRSLFRGWRMRNRELRGDRRARHLL